MADPAEVDEGEDHAESSVLKDLRAKAKRVEEAEARAAKAERALGITTAGLGHLDEDQIAALVGSGEFNAEAAKAKAEKWGWLADETPTPTTTEPAPDAGLAQMEKFGAAGTNVEPPPPAAQEFLNKVQDFQGRPEELMDFIFRQNAHLLET